MPPANLGAIAPAAAARRGPQVLEITSSNAFSPSPAAKRGVRLMSGPSRALCQQLAPMPCELVQSGAPALADIAIGGLWVSRDALTLCTAKQ